MPIAEFKVYYDNKAAKQEKLDEIEEIVVEQQVNRVWEARIKIPVCVSEEGIWEGEEDAVRQDFTRVRIEIRVGEGDWNPLIDGRVVGQDSERSATPGKSMITLVVHDDSALLHREDQVEPHDANTDSEIARKIFNGAALGGKPDVDETPARPDNPAAAIMQRGTKMQILRSLAARYRNYYAYVLPGKAAGESVGCFKKLPEQPDEKLPALVMFGEDRNLAEFNVRHNARSPARVEAATLSLRDKAVTTSTASFRDATLLSNEPPTAAKESDQTVRRLPPGQSDVVDLDGATEGAAADSGFSLEATGSVLPLCYKGVLSPYRVVPARLSDSRYSANYVIFKVTHTLTRSNYTQSFTLRGNAVSAKAGGGASIPQPSASASVSFNLQINIF